MYTRQCLIRLMTKYWFPGKMRLSIKAANEDNRVMFSLCACLFKTIKVSDKKAQRYWMSPVRTNGFNSRPLFYIGSILKSLSTILITDGSLFFCWIKLQIVEYTLICLRTDICWCIKPSPLKFCSTLSFALLNPV